MLRVYTDRSFSFDSIPPARRSKLPACEPPPSVPSSRARSCSPRATPERPRAAPEPAPVDPTARAPLIDVTASLAPARAAFNARKGEARFLTLLAPT
jgi:hypothetical protein